MVSLLFNMFPTVSYIHSVSADDWLNFGAVAISGPMLSSMKIIPMSSRQTDLKFGGKEKAGIRIEILGLVHFS